MRATEMGSAEGMHKTSLKLTLSLTTSYMCKTSYTYTTHCLLILTSCRLPNSSLNSSLGTWVGAWGPTGWHRASSKGQLVLAWQKMWLLKSDLWLFLLNETVLTRTTYITATPKKARKPSTTLVTDSTWRFVHLLDDSVCLYMYILYILFWPVHHCIIVT